MRTIHVAALTTIQDGRLLVVRKAGTQKWMQPGGKLQEGESPLETLEREIHEELGCKIRYAQLVGRFHTETANEPDARLTADVFHAELDGDPQPQAEIEEFKWLNRRELLDHEIAPLIERSLPLQRKEPSVLRPESRFLAELTRSEPYSVHLVRPWPMSEAGELLTYWAQKVNLPGDPTFRNLAQDLLHEGDRTSLPPAVGDDPGFTPRTLDKLGIRPYDWIGVAWLTTGEFFQTTGENLRKALPRTWECGSQDVVALSMDRSKLLYFCADGAVYSRIPSSSTG